MMRSVKLLTFLQLRGFLGINEALHSKDSKKKGRLGLVCAAFLILGAMLCIYAGLLAYGFILMGMTEIIPLYLAVIISLVTFLFSVFRAGPSLFNMKTYEMLIVLPVKPAAIIISRFLTLYLEDLIISVLATASVLVVCAMTLTLSPVFYIFMILGSLILPLLPMTAAMIVGTAIYAVTSRMRHKNIMQILFSLVFLAVYFWFIQMMGDGELAEMVDAFSSVVYQLENIYPPAKWFAAGVWGDIFLFLVFLLVSIALFSVFALLVGKFFTPISTALSSQTAKRNFVMKAQKDASPMKACFFRERKRYFSSSVYVMNTIIGYIMAIALSALMLFGDMSVITSVLSSDVLSKLAVFVLAMVINLSPTTTSAISMEGKQFWLTQSLPVSTKTVMDAKLLLGLVFAVPSVLVSSVLLAFAIRPTGLDLLWLFLVPLLYAFFGAVAGLFVNIKAPMLVWDSEGAPVKQSKAVLLMMFVSFATALMPMILLFVVPGVFTHVVMAATVAALTVLTALMYRNISGFHLNRLLEK